VESKSNGVRKKRQKARKFGAPHEKQGRRPGIVRKARSAGVSSWRKTRTGKRRVTRHKESPRKRPELLTKGTGKLARGEGEREGRQASSEGGEGNDEKTRGKIAAGNQSRIFV